MNFEILPKWFYVVGFEIGITMIIASIVMAFVTVKENLGFIAGSQTTPTPDVVIWLDANGNYQVAIATPTPCLVTSYIVTANSCK